MTKAATMAAYRHVGHSLKVLRVDAGLTQGEVCGRIHLPPDGLSIHQLRRLEQGRTRPQYHVVEAILEAIGADLSDLQRLRGPPME